MDGLHAGDAGASAGGEERLAAEGETALARLVMDGGDLAHASGHLAGAFAADPRLPDAHEALAEFARRAGGPQAALELFDPDEPFAGTLICRAHLQAACGNWPEALMLVAAAVRADHERPWSHVAWLTQEALPALVPPQAVTQALAHMVTALPDPLPEDAREAVRPFHDLAAAVVEQHRGDASLAAIGSALARRMGDTDRAVAWAERAHRLQPDHIPAVMLGYALRAAGRPDEALRVWQEEIARDGSDLSLMVDIAELYASTGRPGLGLPWAERAAAADPEHPQAAPAVLGVRYAADGDPAHLLALADHLRTRPDHPYAATVLARHSEWQPWLGVVATATEATVNVLHRILDDPEMGADRTAGVQLAASMIEPPSASLAFLAAFPRGEIVNRSVGEPDPREPVRPVGRAVWRYEGLTAHPAVPAPSPEAARLVRDTASATWPHIPAAYDHGVRLSGLALDDLLGVLAHPPEPPDDQQGRFLRAHRPELWIRAVQTFACLGLAHHRADEPWVGSVRRSVLLDLLDGPEDWVSEAAAFAMVATAWVDPSVREDAGLRVTERMLAAATAYRTREVTVLGSLCRLVLLCPWLEPACGDLARDLLAAIRRSADEVPAGAGDRAREMARAAEARGRSRLPAPGPAEPQRRRGLFRRRRG
ncbi:tetratricopeptide repeat protein [Actinacidiphila guanduensis]|nr:hypothetical protein [Actinacidiphila guanduensis]